MWGLEMRAKTTSIDATTATRMPTSMPRKRVAKNATPRPIRSDRLTVAMWRISATSKSPITATMMMAPSAAWGSVSNSGVKNATVASTIPAVMMEASGVRAPAVSLTAVRENPPVTG